MTHPNDILIGAAKVPWALAMTGPPRIAPEPGSRWEPQTMHSEGWVLPGGARTTDRGAAEQAAYLLSNIIMRNARFIKRT